MKIIKLTMVLTAGLVLLLAGFNYSQDSTKAPKKELKEKKKSAQAKQIKLKSQNFVDKNGDGYNDNAPDDDGDGIPNSLDPDYHPGNKLKAEKKLPYIDLDGDGINDNLQKMKKAGKKPVKSKELKPQDGTTPQNNARNKGDKQKGKKRGQK